MHLLNCHRVRRDGELSSAGKGLSASLHVDQVQARAQTLVVDEVGEEVKQVSGEAGSGGCGNEAVDGGIPVGARVELELDAGNGSGSNGGASRGDWSCTTQRCKPDHNLVLVGAIGGGAEEHVVGDVGDDVGGGVAVDR